MISLQNDLRSYTYSVQTTDRKPDQTAAPRMPRELAGSAGYLLARLGMTLKARSIKEFDRAGLITYSYGVLALLDEGSCKSQATIADALMLDRSQVVGLLDALEEQGLIERRRDRNDRRRHVVSVTPAGRQALKRCRSIVKRLEEAFLAPLDEDERATLHALLLRIAQHHDPRFAPVQADGGA
jgi:DNA-binding MarR family transcriptional regulator